MIHLGGQLHYRKIIGQRNLPNISNLLNFNVRPTNPFNLIIINFRLKNIKLHVQKSRNFVLQV